jgi:hypothetical protein
VTRLRPGALKPATSHVERAHGGRTCRSEDESAGGDIGFHRGLRDRVQAVITAYETRLTVPSD